MSAASEIRPSGGTAGTGTDAPIADALIRAQIDRVPIRPFTRKMPFLRLDTAYDAQRLLVEHRLQAGEKVIGTKLGLTSRVKRQALGIDEPVYGRLTSGMLIPPGQALQLDGLIHPRAEPEIAFLIGKRIVAPTTVVGVLTATEAVFPAIEIVDSRYYEPFRLPDSVADNAGAARVVLGTRGRAPDELVDLDVLGCVFRYRGSDRHRGGWRRDGPSGRGAGMAGRGAGGPRRGIEAGAIVLSGGLTASVPLNPRSVATAEFDGLGSIGVHCA